MTMNLTSNPNKLNGAYFVYFLLKVNGRSFICLRAISLAGVRWSIVYTQRTALVWISLAPCLRLAFFRTSSNGMMRWSDHWQTCQSFCPVLFTHLLRLNGTCMWVQCLKYSPELRSLRCVRSHRKLFRATNWEKWTHFSASLNQLRR